MDYKEQILIYVSVILTFITMVVGIESMLQSEAPILGLLVIPACVYTLFKGYK